MGRRKPYRERKTRKDRMEELETKVARKNLQKDFTSIFIERQR
jgi:hypothetical protein